MFCFKIKGIIEIAYEFSPEFSVLLKNRFIFRNTHVLQKAKLLLKVRLFNRHQSNVTLRIYSKIIIGFIF